MLTEKELPAEITRLLEAGVNKHLNSSIFYSPLRYFYKKFKRNNPKIIQNARQIVEQDIAKVLDEVPYFSHDIFLYQGDITPIGKPFLKRIYNIGINLLKKRLTTMQAFKVITNSTFRMQVYGFILKSVKKAVIEYMQKDQIDDQSKG